MKKSLKTVTGLIAIVMAITSISYIHADEGKGNKGENRAKVVVKRLDKIVNLSNAQEEEISAIVLENMPMLKKSKKKSKDGLHAIFTADSITADEVLAMMKSHREEGKHEEKMQQMAKTIAAVHAVLTPKQRQAFVDNKRGFKAIFGKKHHKMKGEHGKKNNHDDES